MDWLIDRFIDLVIARLIDWLIDWFSIFGFFLHFPPLFAFFPVGFEDVWTAAETRSSERRKLAFLLIRRRDYREEVTTRRLWRFGVLRSAEFRCHLAGFVRWDTFVDNSCLSCAFPCPISTCLQCRLTGESVTSRWIGTTIGWWCPGGTDFLCWWRLALGAKRTRICTRTLLNKDLGFWHLHR